MKNSTISFLIITLVVSLAIASGLDKSGESLRIYLPREVTIQSDCPSLGQIAIIRGSEELKSKAENITLGRISTPGQNITVNRSIVLSRLASNGIDSDNVTFTGAAEAKVNRQHRVVSGVEFAKAASEFLKNNLPDSSVSTFDLVRSTQDFIVGGVAEDLKLSCYLSSSPNARQAIVRTRVFIGDTQIGHRDLTYNFKYNRQKIVAKVDIPSGGIISAENVKIEKTISSFPAPANWKLPYGLAVRRAIKAGTVIDAKLLASPQPEILLKRNQIVLIKIDNAGLVASAMGKALQSGTVGDLVKVQNIDSRITIVARVRPDGTVEPIF
ncbi:MAG: flagellar basal body P-ring formation chaperone FlgA [Anaerohalosphaeraceae bacterium]|nr:flagellar basal body P-ring formation chaperone FlgA [Anaerohalosphaeraceae bacterium]